MLDAKRTLPGEPGPAPEDQPAKVGRYLLKARRKVGFTLHPDTIDNLTALAVRLSTSRGHLIDVAVGALSAAYETGTAHCAHGARCRWDLREVPRIL